MRPLVSLATATVVFASLSTVFPAEIFRRARSLEERIGRVELRHAYGPRLQVIVKCDSDPAGCLEERVYAEVVSLRFLNGVRVFDGDGIIEDEEPIGTIRLAVDFSDADRQALWSRFRGLLSRLSADAFVEPLGGWGPLQPPFDKQTLSVPAELPSWACFESGSGTTVVRFQGQAAVHRYDEPPTQACAQMKAATADAYPEVLQTMASPRRLLELVVEHEDVVRIDGDDPLSLATRPEGVELVKQKTASRASVESTSEVIDGGMARATHMEHGWRFDARAAPAEMPIAALDQNAWLHSWTIIEVERELGPNPREQVVATERLYAAFLATVPATSGVAGTFPEPTGGARIDRPGFLRLLGTELDRHGGSLSERIEALVRRPRVGLKTEGWLVVLCRENGSATYFLPPTKAFNRVTNAAFFCGALEARLR